MMAGITLQFECQINTKKKNVSQTRSNHNIYTPCAILYLYIQINCYCNENYYL